MPKDQDTRVTKYNLRQAVEHIYKDMQPTYGQFKLLAQNIEEKTDDRTWYAIKTLGFVIGKMEQFPIYGEKIKGAGPDRHNHGNLRSVYREVKNSILTYGQFPNDNEVSYSVYNRLTLTQKMQVLDQCTDLLRMAEQIWNDTVFNEFKKVRSTINSVMAAPDDHCVIIIDTHLNGGTTRNKDFMALVANFAQGQSAIVGQMNGEKFVYIEKQWNTVDEYKWPNGRLLMSTEANVAIVAFYQPMPKINNLSLNPTILIKEQVSEEGSVGFKHLY